MSKLTINNTPFEGLFVVDTDAFIDHRGAFARWFCDEELGHIIGDRHVIFVCCERIEKNTTIQGMHFQKPLKSGMLFARCIYGNVSTVVIDMRQNSPTYLKQYSVELSAENMKLLVIPEGFAQSALSKETESKILYLSTELYSPEYFKSLDICDIVLEVSDDIKS